MAKVTSTHIDLLRHGACEGGEIFRGSTDVALSELGWQQMRDAIQVDDQWDHILTSPLLRCREFAAELSAQQHIPFTVAHDFKEISFGDWEGKTREQVAAEYGDHQANFWRDAENHPPVNGETIQAFHQRIGDEIRQQGQDCRGRGRPGVRGVTDPRQPGRGGVLGGPRVPVAVVGAGADPVRESHR